MSAPTAVPGGLDAPNVAIAPGLAIFILALLLSLQPITTDLYLPALPALTQELGSPVSAGQLTLSALLLAFGGSQLLWGPLSDRWGRRPVLLGALLLYLLAALANAWAPSMTALVASRAVQGAALGAVVMCARAMVRDLYSPLAGARAMSKALTGLGICAALSAPLGGLLTQWLGWRAALLALALFALFSLAIVASRLPETLRQRNPQALQPRTLVRTWALILRHPVFWTFSLLSSTAYAALFSFLAASSFVFIGVLGLSRHQYGLLLLSNALAYMSGTLLCRRLLARLSLPRTVAIAGALSLSGAVLLLLVALAGWHSTMALMAPFYLCMLGHGIHMPCAQSGCVSPFPQAAGAASALNGFMMMLISFGVGLWLGQALDGSIWPLVHSVVLWAGLTAALAWTLVQRHGDPRHAS